MARGKTKHLVIVESPTKAEKIGDFLGAGYAVEATGGHVVDLPKKGLAVDVDRGFEPQYETVRGKGKVIDSLRRLAREAEEILIATDPDREGEAIGFHIAQKLGYDREDGRRFRRIRFNELSKGAVIRAVENPGDIDLHQVDAQQARRILDRLVGYGLSPLLWKKISPVDPVSRTPLSAGRVQSVAVRLLVERERERRSFRSGSWWDLLATLAAEDGDVAARLVRLGGRKLATGADFDEETGKLEDPGSVLLLDENAARELVGRLREATFVVASVSSKEYEQKPYDPFRTSTLQQEAGRKLGFSARETMRIAQRLYEAGHITYMRTDSTQLSDAAVEAAREAVESRFGPEYLSPKPRTKGKVAKGAQEAHEAIRPSGTGMPDAGKLGLSGRDGMLYDLIWKRTLATQMANARRRTDTAVIRAEDAEFVATGRVTLFPGFLRVYVQGADDPEAALDDREDALPSLASDDVLPLRSLDLQDHATRPPSRYTESSLVQALEDNGVGRPGTYVPTIATIEDRGYVEVQGRQLVPTFLAFAVTELLEKHFEDLVDVGFTADMETRLDRIAAGEVDWRAFLDDFYRGPDGFETRLVEREDRIDPREASTLDGFDDLAGEVRIGRWGPFIEMMSGEEPLRVSIPRDLAPADLTPETASALLEAKEKADRPLCTDPDTGKPVFLLVGRYGPFVQLGETGDGEEKPKRASLLKGMNVEDVTPELALKLLSLPRLLGEHPDGGEVRAGVGRFGPFVVHEGEFRSLEKGDDVLEIGLDRALELLAKPKAGRRRSAPKVLRALGEHPSDGAPVELLDGRYGPYVRHGKTNASLPKGETPEDVTLERALELLAARRSRGGGRSGGKGRGGGRGRSRRGGSGKG